MTRTAGSVKGCREPGRRSSGPSHSYLGWPPSDPELGSLSEVDGTVVMPMSEGYVSPQILLATRVDAPGQHLRRGLWVRYHVGAVHYRQFLPAEITYCTPEAMDGDTCPFLGGGAS